MVKYVYKHTMLGMFYQLQMKFIISHKLKSHEIPLNLVEIASSMWDKIGKARDKTAYAII